MDAAWVTLRVALCLRHPRDRARHARGGRARPLRPLPGPHPVHRAWSTRPMVMPEVITGLPLLLFFVADRPRPRLLDGHAGAHDADAVLRHRGGAGAARHVRPLPGGGRDRSRGAAAQDLPHRHAAADRARRRRRASFSPSRCRWTTSCSRASTPARARRRCRSASTARSGSGSRRRSTRLSTILIGHRRARRDGGDPRQQAPRCARGRLLSDWRRPARPRAADDGSRPGAGGWAAPERSIRALTSGTIADVVPAAEPTSSVDRAARAGQEGPRARRLYGARHRPTRALDQRDPPAARRGAHAARAAERTAFGDLADAVADGERRPGPDRRRCGRPSSRARSRGGASRRGAGSRRGDRRRARPA